MNLTLPEVWNVVLKTAMAKHPDDRYQSASDFAAAIRHALAQAPARPAKAPTNVPIDTPSRISSHPTLRVVAIILGLLIAVATVIYLATDIRYI